MRKTLLAVPLLGAALVTGVAAWQSAAPAAARPTGSLTEEQLLEGFRKSTVASVSDAVDQVVGQRGFMSHDMRPRIPGQIVGRAITALLRQAPPEKATAALSAQHSVAMIDTSKPGDVGIIVVENGLDVAGMGGLMATTASVRGMGGVLIDGGVRDLAELRALKFPTYSRSVVPSSSVGRWASVNNNVPVQCAGVQVKPGDIIVAGEDGVVRVPSERAAEVLKRSQEIDDRETRMVPMIRQHKALSKVIQIFNRI
ncbi:MAG TPA: RraA family protein [Bryobacteraceae bacterium]|nr:RraA family protein [Bryobacteraceae bacterium]